jgi:hypothetical protein
MSSPCTPIVVDSGPESKQTQPNKNQKTKVQPNLWPTAPSLRPDTIWLAEACMEGDEEAIAMRDAWQFQTSRATRLITLSLEDGTPVTDADLENYTSPLDILVTDSEKVKSLSVEGMMLSLMGAVQREASALSGSTGCEHEQEQDEHVTLMKLQNAMLVDSQRSVVTEIGIENETSLEQLLNDSMVRFQSATEHSKEHLWIALKRFAYYRCERSYKQLSFRRAGTELDVAHAFAAHAIRKIEAHKYKGTGLFSHWINKVFRTYADTELQKITRDKSMFFSLTETNLDLLRNC